jgi:hypothetical protein
VLVPDLVRFSRALVLDLVRFSRALVLGLVHFSKVLEPDQARFATPVPEQRRSP